MVQERDIKGLESRISCLKFNQVDRNFKSVLITGIIGSQLVRTDVDDENLKIMANG